MGNLQEICLTKSPEAFTAERNRNPNGKKKAKAWAIGFLGGRGTKHWGLPSATKRAIRARERPVEKN